MATINLKVFVILLTYIGFARGSGIKAKLMSLVVTSDIKVRYARTLVSAEYFNDKNSPAIADFHVILPDRAYISNFSMEMNGNVTVGVVKEKEKAKKLFDTAVNQGESAGYVSVNHRFINTFNMTVNVEPNVKVVFNLTYEELLKRTNGRYKHRILLPNEKIVDKLLVEVFISEPQEIEIFDEDAHEGLSVRSMEHIDNKHVHIIFDPTKEEQNKLIQNGEFVVEYDVKREDANVLYTLDGYFVHFYAPDDEPVWPKNVIVMIDVSGSMAGDKLDQVKLALRNILQVLNMVRDTFILGTFANNVQWRNIDSLEEGMAFVDSLKASGGTDINQAILDSLDKFNTRRHSVDILFFLTDGDPTSGITNKDEIRSNIKNANEENVMIFTLGFGDDCDLEFLENIASENGGFSRKIYAAVDSGEQITQLFESISNLLLKNVMVTYLNATIDSRYLTPTSFKSIFSGSEIAIAGRFKNISQSGGHIESQISGESPSGKWIKTQNLKLVSGLDFFNSPELPIFPNLTRFEMLPNITRKTWAYVTLKQMIEENAPRDDIVEMAIENGFVTPYTSMVVTKEQLRGDIHEERNIKNKDTAPEFGLAFDKDTAPEFGLAFEYLDLPFDKDTAPEFGLAFDKDTAPEFDKDTAPEFGGGGGGGGDRFSVHHKDTAPEFAEDKDPIFGGGGGGGGGGDIFAVLRGGGNRFSVLHKPTDTLFNQRTDILLDKQGHPFIGGGGGGGGDRFSVHRGGGGGGGDRFSVHHHQRIPDIDQHSIPDFVAQSIPDIDQHSIPDFDQHLIVDFDLEPALKETPAVIVKPYRCEQMLCVSEDMVCKNVTKLLLLRDRRADVEIYSYPLDNDNCMRNFIKITIQTRTKRFEVTPSVATINKKKINVTNRSLIRLKFKNFLELNIYFNRERPQHTLSVQFIVLDKMRQAEGLYSQYMKSFDCTIRPDGKMTLSHMQRKFKKEDYSLPGEGSKICYIDETNEQSRFF